VHPEWQGKGIGKRLVEWGTRIADQEGVCNSVITGEPKRAFYGKCGLTEKLANLGEGDDGGGIILFRMAKANRGAESS